MTPNICTSLILFCHLLFHDHPKNLNLSYKTDPDAWAVLEWKTHI